MPNTIPYIRRSLPVPSKKVPTPSRTGNQRTQGSPLPKWSLPLGGSVIAVSRPDIGVLDRVSAAR